MERYAFIRVVAIALALAIGLGFSAQGGYVGKMPDRTTAAASIDIPPSMICQLRCEPADMCFDACCTFSVCNSGFVPIGLDDLAFGAAKFDAPARDARPDRANVPDPHPPKPIV